MARIPVAQSTRQITDVSPTQRIQREAFTAPARAKRQISQAISTVAKRFEEAHALSQATRADTFARQRLMELENEAANTKDIFNVKQFQEKIETIRQEASNQIISPIGKQKFQESFGRTSMQSGLNIRNTLHKRQVDQMKAEMLGNIDELHGSPHRNQELNLLLQEHADKGIISREGAFNLGKTTQKAWHLADIQKIKNHIANDADNAKLFLENDAFDFLSAEEKSDLINEANQQIKRNAAEANLKVTTRWIENGTEVTRNLQETKVADLLLLLSENKISPKLANSYIKSKRNPDNVMYESDTAILKDLAFKSVNEGEDLLKLQENIAQAVERRQIQEQEAAKVLDMAVNAFTKAEKIEVGRTERNKLLKTGFDFFLRTFPPTMIHKTMFDLIDLSQNEPDDKIPEIIDKVTKEAVNEAIPETVTLKDIPNATFNRGQGIGKIAEGDRNIKADWIFRNGKLIKVE